MLCTTTPTRAGGGLRPWLAHVTAGGGGCQIPSNLPQNGSPGWLGVPACVRTRSMPCSAVRRGAQRQILIGQGVVRKVATRELRDLGQAGLDRLHQTEVAPPEKCWTLYPSGQVIRHRPEVNTRPTHEAVAFEPYSEPLLLQSSIEASLHRLPPCLLSLGQREVCFVVEEQDADASGAIFQYTPVSIWCLARCGAIRSLVGLHRHAHLVACLADHLPLSQLLRLAGRTPAM